MKKSILVLASIVLSLLSFTLNAQTPETKPETTPTTAQTWDYRKNPTVAAITSQYEGKYITTKTTVTDEDIFPAIGSFVSSTEGPALTITLDEQTKGAVWIEGLPQGKFKAYLRKSPSTYKIPAQKTESGTDVYEGTLIYDKEANTLNIVIGKNYNSADPAIVFAPEPVAEEGTVKTKTQKTKTKVKADSKPKTFVYSGTKLVVVKETENN
jgi:hypothetical protein